MDVCDFFAEAEAGYVVMEQASTRSHLREHVDPRGGHRPTNTATMSAHVGGSRGLTVFRYGDRVTGVSTVGTDCSSLRDDVSR